MSSKQKPKQKKTEAVLELQKQCEQLQRRSLQREIRLKRLQQQNSRIGLNLHQTSSENDKLKQYIKQEVEKLNLSNRSYKDRVAELTDKKNQLEIQVATATARLQFQRKQHEDWRKEKEREFDDSRRHYATEMGRFQIQANQYSLAINDRQNILAEKASLLKTIEQQRQNFKRQLADKDRDKIQALDSLKKQMMDKFREVKSNLLSIRRDQLSNNTRLTLLQNHQLIQQLEYQSLNTQKLVERNVVMERRVKELQTDVQIREEVEKEVVKRAVISKKMLQTFHQKAVTLEREKEELERSKEGQVCNQQEQEGLKNKIFEMSRRIQGAFARIQELEKELVLKSTEVSELRKKQEDVKGQNASLSQLISRYYNECLQGKMEDLSGKELDLATLQRVQLKEWKPWQVQIVVQALINKLKPHITPAHFNLQVWRRIADGRVGKLCPIDKQNVIAEEMSGKERNDGDYVRSLSLQKKRLFYNSKKKLDEKGRSLTRIGSDHTVSISKYVQSGVREWGNDGEKREKGRNLVERFMKPIKFQLK